MAERLKLDVDTLVQRGVIPAPKGPKLNLRGRPPSYKPEFCDLVIEMSNEGHSLGGFAGRIGVDRPTINDWLRLYPDFNRACLRAATGKLYFWETKLIEVATTGGSGSQGTVAMFGVVNAASASLAGPDWRSKTEVEHTGQISLSAVIDRVMAKINQIAEAQNERNYKTIEHDQSFTDESETDLFSGMDT